MNKAEHELALVHEWLPAQAGSEKTFESMARAFPKAELHALSHNPAAQLDFAGRQVKTTILNRAALNGARPQHVPLMVPAWRAHRTKQYSHVITSSHAFSRAFPAALTAIHLSYTYAPLRYVWTPEIDSGRNPLVERIATTSLPAMRALDLRYARTVDSFAAISSEVRSRIERFYDRDARVIFPPVDTAYFTPAHTSDHGERPDHILSLSRFVPYKRHDLAIRTGAHLGLPVVVAGSGPDENRLRQIAQNEHPGGVEFVINPTQEQVRQLLREAMVLVFGSNEDFGIVPVEAQACGTPVVALDAGGSKDTVVDGTTGRLVAEQTVESFGDGLIRLLDALPSAEACRNHALGFSDQVFRSAMQEWADEFGYRSE